MSDDEWDDIGAAALVALAMVGGVVLAYMMFRW